MATLNAGASLLWFSFPGRPYEVAALYDREGRLLGHYTNLVVPPELDGEEWRIEDRFLDLWQPARGDPRLLDREELREARASGLLDEEEAARVEATARKLLRRARAERWPPSPVLRWDLGTVDSLRYRRDRPGEYVANLISNRIIAFGLYFLGLASLTSLVMAAWPLLGHGRPPQGSWLAVLAVEAGLLLPVALAGRLPATRRVRPDRAMTETTLFFGAAAMATAVLVVNDSSLWRVLLGSVYGTLAVFLAVFAACRSLLDRAVPVLALAGLAVCILALGLL